MWEVPFLYPRERSIFISGKKEAQRGIWMIEPCQVSPSILHLVHALCPIIAFQHFHSPSNLAKKHSGLTSTLGLISLWKLSNYINLTSKKVYTFFLFIYLLLQGSQYKNKRLEDIFCTPTLSNDAAWEKIKLHAKNRCIVMEVVEKD